MFHWTTSVNLVGIIETTLWWYFEMKLFQRLYKIYRFTGTYPSSQQNYTLNARNLFILLTLILYLAAIIAFILYEASNVRELAESFFEILTTFEAIVTFLVHFWKIPNVLVLIDKFNEHIENSVVVGNGKVYSFFQHLSVYKKLRNIAAYFHFDSQFDIATPKTIFELIDFIGLSMEILLMILAPLGFLVPILLINCINYFIYNLGNDSFLLLVPTKYIEI